MNIGLFTVQIATWPKRYRLHTGREVIQLYTRIPNPKKGRSFYYIISYVVTSKNKQLFDWYQKGDYLIIKGNLKFSKFKLSKNKIKYIEINIIKDFPITLER